MTSPADTHATSSTPSVDTTDADVAMAAGTWRVRVAGAITALAGLLAAVTGFQIVISVRFFGEWEWIGLVPWFFMLLGPVMIVVGAILYRARGWTAPVAAALSALAFLATGGWNVFAILNQIFSCVAAVAPLLAFGATLMSALAIPDARAATKARARLAQAGISLGL